MAGQVKTILKNIAFRISRCNNKPYCESETNIDKFLNEATVDFWSLYNKLDLSIYDRLPT